MKSKTSTACEFSEYNLFVEGVNEPLPCFSSTTLLQALIDAGIALEANCGGRGTCGKCRIQVLQGQVTGLNNLPASLLPGDSFLACQTYPGGHISVRLHKSEVSAKGKMQQSFTLLGQSLVRKTVVAPEYPTLDNHFSLQEMFHRLVHSTSLVTGTPGLLKQLAEVFDTGPERLTVVMAGNECAAVEAGDTSSSLFGVAFDIGTTTVVGLLVDLANQKVIATHSETNPQSAFGADVISRISAAEKPGGLEALANIIRQCLNRIVLGLCASANIKLNEIYTVTIAGNSTMQHLLLGISPLSLVRKPYIPVFKNMEPFMPGEIDLSINPAGRVILLPNIASFVGADTTAAILAADQDISVNPILLIDLGTNGEMALGNSKRLFACSTAAGPAFEGAHIRDGMRASTGAITDVAITDDVIVTTINGAKPRGICGSGIIKAIAELIKQRIITSTGRFRKDIAEQLSPNLAWRFKYKDNQWEFVLVAGAYSATGLDISITQSDIRQIQLVKSAICSGIQILIEKANLDEPIPVFLAGAFGNYIDIESALQIGMIPGFSKEQVKSIGNAAGVGAVQALLSKEKLERCLNIANKVEFIELADEPNFQKFFLANLSFPEVNL